MIIVFAGASFFEIWSASLPDKESLKWINKMLNDNEQHLRQDIFSFSRLFSLIIHFELEHYDLLEYMLKSIGRFYQKGKMK